MMDQVNGDHTPLLVTRSKGKPVVMISLEDYEAMDETMYLVSSPSNRSRLETAVADLNHGHGEERPLFEE